ncbi:MAG: vitamin K epoxide reductase family protein [Anaerolineae bacterium]|nr:vitamin K epoxide reductase family protein [Anaerolineae bacterium]
MSKTKARSMAASDTRRDWWRNVSIGLCIVGILVAGYMAWAELTGNETVCTDMGNIDCAAVQTSAYAKTLGLSVAVLGTLGYVAILGVLVLEDQIDLAATYGRTAIVGMALYGTMFQVYLSVIEETVLDAWCQWCITSFVIIGLLLLIGTFRLYRFLQPLRT